jgi:hypothetical protein
MFASVLTSNQKLEKNYKGQLSVTNNQFDDINSSASYGCVFSLAMPNLEQQNFTNNIFRNVTIFRKALEKMSGVIYFFSSDKLAIIFKNNTFIGIICSGSDGGAVVLEFNGGDLLIEYSTFSNCTANTGGAICSWSAFKLIGCIFRLNKASLFNGGNDIYFAIANSEWSEDYVVDTCSNSPSKKVTDSSGKSFDEFFLICNANEFYVSSTGKDDNLCSNLAECYNFLAPLKLAEEGYIVRVIVKGAFHSPDSTGLESERLEIVGEEVSTVLSSKNVVINNPFFTVKTGHLTIANITLEHSDEAKDVFISLVDGGRVSLNTVTITSPVTINSGSGLFTSSPLISVTSKSKSSINILSSIICLNFSGDGKGTVFEINGNVELELNDLKILKVQSKSEVSYLIEQISTLVNIELVKVEISSVTLTAAAEKGSILFLDSDSQSSLSIRESNFTGVCFR